MPYKFWKMFDDSTYEPRKSMEEPVPEDIMKTLNSLPTFQKWYDESMAPEEFVKLQPAKDTLNQFLTARDDLLKVVRGRMIQ